MPLTATIEDIKAHQEKVEKDKITSEGLPPCPSCNLEPSFFKIHAYRERRFLVIVKMIVESVFCTLVRFRCPDCGKTLTNYPDFAIPHKHYTRQTIEGFSNVYIKDDPKTYETSVITDDGMPEYPNSDQSTLAASTVHRWITTLASFIIAYQDVFTTSLQKNIFTHFCDNSGELVIPKKKYETHKRMECLLRCRWFFNAESFLKNKLSPSLQ